MAAVLGLSVAPLRAQFPMGSGQEDGGRVEEGDLHRRGRAEDCRRQCRCAPLRRRRYRRPQRRQHSALLAQSSDRPRLKWTFVVLDTDEHQCVCRARRHPSRAALALIRNESELAGVLGHEISHVVFKHADRDPKAKLVAAPGKAMTAADSDLRNTSRRRIRWCSKTRGARTRSESDAAGEPGQRCGIRAGRPERISAARRSQRRHDRSQRPVRVSDEGTYRRHHVADRSESLSGKAIVQARYAARWRINPWR